MLIYFYESITQLVEAPDSEQLRKTLLLESANLSYFLDWGYENESSGGDRCCYSARLVALLSEHWERVRPTESPIDSLERGGVAAQRNGDTLAQADIYVAMGDIRLSQDGLEGAKPSYKQAVALYRSAREDLSEPIEIATVCVRLGDVLARCEDRKGALFAYREAGKCYRSASRLLDVADVLLKMGQLQEQASVLEDALKYYEAAQRLYGEQRHQAGVRKAESLIFRVQRQANASSIRLVSFEFTTVVIDSQGHEVNRDIRSSRCFVERLSDQITLEMVEIPGGSFLMGSPSDEEGRLNWEGPQHQVMVPPFFMGRFPITQAQWRAIASLPQVNRTLEPNPSYFNGDNHPVEVVSWDDAVEACERLSAYTGYQYRLPSEAEWEYACRAGTQTPFACGETITPEIANYDGNYAYGEGPKGDYRNTTTPVDHFPYANAFGLSDMHGNVWEWCQDYWHNNYQGAPLDGGARQKDPLHSNNGRVIRGGSWFNFPRLCRSAYHGYGAPDSQYYLLGFRVVLAPRSAVPSR